MATNTGVSCLPRNPSLLWFQTPENGHRSYPLFTDNVSNPLKARRAVGDLFEHIKQLDGEVIPDEIFKYIRSAGFGGIFKANNNKYDHPLICALVERWRPETHTFHFPCGEATVTLQDVQVIWGLPVDGPVVTGFYSQKTQDQWETECDLYLGFRGETISHGRIKISELLQQVYIYPDNFDRLSREAKEEIYRQKARTYILAMFAGVIFVDSCHNDVSLNFLKNLDNLSVEGRLSWGSAVLACLYSNLCKGAKAITKGIQGPLLLLQYWAWERITNIAPTRIPNVDHPWNYEHCLAAKWDTKKSHTETPAHVKAAYRQVFSGLSERQFLWMPYMGILSRLPEDCTRSSEVWTYRGYIIFWATVETHVPDRVKRQFGCIQDIPHDDIIPRDVRISRARAHAALHKFSLTGGKDKDWGEKHAMYINQWNNRRDNIATGVPGTGTTDTYMQWYWDHTVLLVTNPSRVPPANQYPPWGDQLQVMREGFVRVANHGREGIIQDPDNAPRYQPYIDIPRAVMQYSNDPDRLGYSSQNMDFSGNIFQPLHPQPQPQNMEFWANDYQPQPPPPPPQHASPFGGDDYVPDLNQFETPEIYGEGGFVSQLLGDESQFFSEYQQNTPPRGPRNVTPIPMASYGEGTSGAGTSGAGQQVTDLAGDENQQQQVAEEAPGGVRRGNRTTNPTYCFTGGRLGHGYGFRGDQH